MAKEKSAVTTRTLAGRLFQTSSFERFKARYAEALRQPTLSTYIAALCAERGESHESVIRRACLDRVYGHQIFAGMRQPTRDKVIQLAFGFAMDVEQSQNLLKIARKCALSPRVERDAAILFCLNRRMCFVDAQCMLAELQLPLLGKEASRE